jgi:hypothetical protein
MLNVQSQNRIGQKLREQYADLPGPLPDRLQQLVAALLAADPSDDRTASSELGSDRKDAQHDRRRIGRLS